MGGWWVTGTTAAPGIWATSRDAGDKDGSGPTRVALLKSVDGIFDVSGYLATTATWWRCWS
jgi:hypothetical protein